MSILFLTFFLQIYDSYMNFYLQLKFKLRLLLAVLFVLSCFYTTPARINHCLLTNTVSTVFPTATTSDYFFCRWFFLLMSPRDVMLYYTHFLLWFCAVLTSLLPGGIPIHCNNTRNHSVLELIQFQI